MYSLFLLFQYIGIVVLFGELCYVFYQKPSRQQVCMLLLIISLMVNFVGYLLELQSVTMGQAIMAVKVAYMGKPFIILLIFMFIMEYCGIKLPDWFYKILTALHLTVTMCVMTCNHQKLYYSSINFTKEGFFPHLVLGHGPLYIIYHTTVVVYLIAMAAACIYKYRNIKFISLN